MLQTESYLARLQAMHKLAHRLEQVIAALRPHFPLSPDNFDPERLDPAAAFALDAFRVRFSDLQDMIGRSLFAAISHADEDESPGVELSTRERIALMEKRGIADATKWREIREIRNQFAHEYPNDHDEKAATLNAAWELSDELLATARRITAYARRHHGIEV